MPGDETYLDDILDAATQITAYTDGVDRESFLADRMIQDAVVRQIEIMGEAAGRVSQQLKDMHPDIDWKGLTQLRNFYIHVYRRINYKKVWQTCRNSVPRIKAAVERIISRADLEE